jgi:CHAT domain-containing protein
MKLAKSSHRCWLFSIPLIASLSCFSVCADDISVVTTNTRALYQTGSSRQLEILAGQLDDAINQSDRNNDKIEALQLLSDINSSRGKRAKALDSLSAALDLTELSVISVSRAASLRSIAERYRSLGSYPKARNILKKAIEMVESGSQPSQVLKDWYGELAYLESELGNNLLAEKAFRKRMALPGCQDDVTQANGYVEIIKSLSRQETGNRRLSQNISAFEEHFSNYPDSKQKGVLAIELGATLSQFTSGNAELEEVALRYLNYGLLSAQKYDDAKYQSYAFGYIGKISLMTKRHDEALVFSRKALALAGEGSYVEIEYIWQWQIAQIYKSKGDFSKALMNYRSAISSVLSIQTQLLSGSRLVFDELVLPVFIEMIDLLLEQAERSDLKNKREALLYEAREVMEQFGTSEVLNFFSGDCVLPAHQVELESIGSGNVVVYPLILSNRISVIVKFPDGIHQYVTRIDETKFSSMVSEFRSMLEQYDDEPIELATLLYDLLVRPYEDKLVEFAITNIIFVPGGALRTIPLSALYDGNQFLIEKYAVSTSLGLQLTNPKALEARELRLLIGGISDEVRGFDALPGVDIEIDKISQQIEGEVLLNADFSTSALANKLGTGNYSIVHLATHGYFDEEPSLSFLLTYDGKFTFENMQETVGLRRYVDQSLELLVLSACETALGNEKAALGLAGISLKSGARSTLASLWSINDQATSLIMIGFYEHLLKGTSKSEALRKAQLKLIGDPEFSHPNLWSSFLLIGNWL